MSKAAAKHTETPWRLNGLAIQYRDSYVGTCDSNGVNDETDDEHNARYIVRACNNIEALLEACKYLLGEETALCHAHGVVLRAIECSIGFDGYCAVAEARSAIEAAGMAEPARRS